MATTQPGGSVTSRTASESRSGPTGSSGPSGGTATGAKFRHGLLQLMIHTIDPLHDGEFVQLNHSNFVLLSLELKPMCILLCA